MNPQGQRVHRPGTTLSLQGVLGGLPRTWGKNNKPSSTRFCDTMNIYIYIGYIHIYIYIYCIHMHMYIYIYYCRTYHWHIMYIYVPHGPHLTILWWEWTMACWSARTTRAGTGGSPLWDATAWTQPPSVGKKRLQLWYIYDYLCIYIYIIPMYIYIYIYTYHTYVYLYIYTHHTYVFIYIYIHSWWRFMTTFLSGTAFPGREYQRMMLSCGFPIL